MLDQMWVEVVVRSGMSGRVSGDEMSNIFEYTVSKCIVGGSVYGGRVSDVLNRVWEESRSGVY